MAMRREFAHTFLRQLGLWLGLLLIVALTHSSAFLAERDGVVHISSQPVVLYAAAPRLTPIKAFRAPNEPHGPAALVPTPAALPVAPRGSGTTLRPSKALWTPEAWPTGWQARAPPDLALQRTT